jgi:purine-binding chemotaxis protein CheW
LEILPYLKHDVVRKESLDKPVIRGYMTDKQMKSDGEQELQFSCFYLGDTLYGYNIDLVQEVNDKLDLTRVPLAPDYVLGILNLRGKIITVIDQQKKIGLQSSKITGKSRVLIIKSGAEYIGLLADRISEVITCSEKEIAKPPSNVNGIQGKLFKGVVHTKNNELLALLDIDAVLEEEQA